MIITSWNSVDSESWTCASEEKQCSFLVYRLTSLPNFTHKDKKIFDV